MSDKAKIENPLNDIFSQAYGPISKIISQKFSSVTLFKVTKLVQLRWTKWPPELKIEKTCKRHFLDQRPDFKMISQKYSLGDPLLAGDQCWPRIRDDRLRLAHAITHVLHHKFGHLKKKKKKNETKATPSKRLIKQKLQPLRRLIKFSTWETKGKHFSHNIESLSTIMSVTRKQLVTKNDHR